ncbi:MAG: MarR family winged helix-turn-helix transcriptional regulator [Micrococcales bacterium]|nr:MarR family winged helix-turn-helix transcriptional regulator [Micrococcales bacterium]
MPVGSTTQSRAKGATAGTGHKAIALGQADPSSQAGNRPDSRTSYETDPGGHTRSLGDTGAGGRTTPGRKAGSGDGANTSPAAGAVCDVGSKDRQWFNSLPGVDPELAGLLQTLMSLNQALRPRETGDRQRPTWAQVAVLGILARCGQVRLSALADLLYLDLSVLSRHVTALEQAGLVARVKDPDDGRAWLVSITKQGQAAVHQVWVARADAIRAALAGIEPSNIAAANTVMAAMANALSQASTD